MLPNEGLGTILDEKTEYTKFYIANKFSALYY